MDFRLTTDTCTPGTLRVEYSPGSNSPGSNCTTAKGWVGIQASMYGRSTRFLSATRKAVSQMLSLLPDAPSWSFLRLSSWRCFSDASSRMPCFFGNDSFQEASERMGVFEGIRKHHSPAPSFPSGHVSERHASYRN